MQPETKDTALAAGYSVVDATTVIGMHLSELIRRHSHELLTGGETKRLLDALNQSHPRLVEGLVPKVLSPGEVQRVLQELLREQVSVCGLGTILEVLVKQGAGNRGTPFLVEQVRYALRRRLVQPLLEADGGLQILETRCAAGRRTAGARPGRGAAPG